MCSLATAAAAAARLAVGCLPRAVAGDDGEAEAEGENHDTRRDIVIIARLSAKCFVYI
jgi:hypothetical protein